MRKLLAAALILGSLGFFLFKESTKTPTSKQEAPHHIAEGETNAREQFVPTPPQETPPLPPTSAPPQVAAEAGVPAPQSQAAWQGLDESTAVRTVQTPPPKSLLDIELAQSEFQNGEGAAIFRVAEVVELGSTIRLRLERTLDDPMEPYALVDAQVLGADAQDLCKITGTLLKSGGPTWLSCSPQVAVVKPLRLRVTQRINPHAQ